MHNLISYKDLLSEKNQARNLGIIAIVAIVFHGLLLPFTMGSTYDAYIHMFFGQHYNQSWFDPWEPRWYTGFSVTSYPPATHMIQGLLQHVFSMKLSFILTMMLGILTLMSGFYRFVRIWAPKAAFTSTVLLVFTSSVTETIHIFGQLPTIFSLGLFLNAMPHVYRWLTTGSWRALLGSVVMAGAATSAHHVTTIFGSVFFIGPLAAYAWVTYIKTTHPFADGVKFRGLFRALFPVIRGGVLAVAILTVVICTVFPYWYWSFTDPITQVPIPHGTRENFIERRDLGMVFFLMPWGATLVFLPYIMFRGFTSNLWPFAASLLLCFVLGTGGTTPIPRMILHGAFDILTLDRFTFWGSVLALPFVGMVIIELSMGKIGHQMVRTFGANVQTIFISFIFFGYAIIAVLIGTLSAFKPLQPSSIDPAPIVQFMETDGHDRWRYLTLGFGDQFAYVSAHTHALSVDGNYHSARRLPALTSYSVERLENAKYLGVGGIGSLQQFLINANEYNLKYIFANDAFYDPLLYATGWNAIARLPNNIVIWEKPNIDPLPFNIPRKNFSIQYRLWWGIVPPFMCTMGFLLIGLTLLRSAVLPKSLPAMKVEKRARNPRRDLRALLFTVCFMTLFVFGLSMRTHFVHQSVIAAPENVIERFHKLLNLRRFYDAYLLLDPKTRPEFAAFHFERMWDGGLLNSFGELRSVHASPTNKEPMLNDFDVETRWLTALGQINNDETMRTIKRDGRWYILPESLPAIQTSERVWARNSADFHVVGRRQPRIETEFYKDMPDRPEFAMKDVKLVKHRDQYYIIGGVINTDADPLALSINGELFDKDHDKLIQSSAGVVSPFRLLPLETAGFRMDFEGRLSIQDAAKYEGFDPDIYLPPIYETEPRYGYIASSSVITDQGLNRDVMLSDIEFEETPEGLCITGRVVNNSIYTIATIKLLPALYGQDGKIAWADVHFVKNVIRPGQYDSFSMFIPHANEIEVIHEFENQSIDINLNLLNRDEKLPNAETGTIPLNNLGGYRSVRFYLDPQIFDEVF